MDEDSEYIQGLRETLERNLRELEVARTLLRNSLSNVEKTIADTELCLRLSDESMLKMRLDRN